MLMHLWKSWEISIDLRQWMWGFNLYYDLEDWQYFNIFIGPIRIGWWEGAEEFWCSNHAKIK